MVNTITGSGSTNGTTGKHEYVPAIQASSRSGPDVPIAGGDNRMPNRTEPTLSPKVSKYAEHLGQLEAANQAALVIRSAETAMSRISDSLGKIKQALTQIIKQYPPYALDDRDRIEYLNSIASLRKQIEALSPFPELAQGVTASTHEIAFPGGNVYSITINHGLRAGLDVPELGERARDGEVAVAYERINHAETRVAEERTMLAAEVRLATSTPDFVVGDLLKVMR